MPKKDTPASTWILRGCLICLAGPVGLCILVVIASAMRSNHLIARVTNSDPKAVLTACRELIKDLKEHPEWKRKEVTISGKDAVAVGDYLYAVPPRDKLPRILTELGSLSVTLDDEHVMICLSAIPRVYILGFAEGTQQYGTDKLIDGLWYSYGPKEDRESLSRKP